MQLDLEQLNELPPVDRDRYMQLEKLFAQPGWKIVVKGAQENIATAMRQAAFATSWDHNRAAIGNMSAWQSIANMEKDTQAGFLQKLADLQVEREARRVAAEHDYE
jgi:hypothetical protein